MLGHRQALTRDQRFIDFAAALDHLVIGLNEFSGYLGLAIAGVVTGYAASLLGPREGLLWFGTAVMVIATLLAWLAVAETLPWARRTPKAQCVGPVGMWRGRGLAPDGQWPGLVGFCGCGGGAWNGRAVSEPERGRG